jgi:hypothetical protein
MDLTMNLVQHLLQLADAVGREMRLRLTASHPAVAKAWVNFGMQGQRVEVRSAYNVSSVEQLDTGRYRVNFAVPFVDADYAWFAFARNAGSANSMKFAAARAQAEAKTTSYVEVICTTAAGTLSDTSELSLMVMR